jgi:hypothetical protein
MVIGIFGESCTGKSSLTAKIAANLCCEVLTARIICALRRMRILRKLCFGRNSLPL